MLPYQSLPEAAAALRRNLTLCETLWFNYSARKSDYFLYCHNILFLFLVFSLIPLPLLFLDVKRFVLFDKYKIQPKVRLSLDEMLRCYKDVFFMFLLVVGPLQLLSYPSVKVFFSIHMKILMNFILGVYMHYSLFVFRVCDLEYGLLLQSLLLIISNVT